MAVSFNCAGTVYAQRSISFQDNNHVVSSKPKLTINTSLTPHSSDYDTVESMESLFYDADDESSCERKMYSSDSEEDSEFEEPRSSRYTSISRSRVTKAQANEICNLHYISLVEMRMKYQDQVPTMNWQGASPTEEFLASRRVAVPQTPRNAGENRFTENLTPQVDATSLYTIGDGDMEIDWVEAGRPAGQSDSPPPSYHDHIFGDIMRDYVMGEG